MNSPGNSANLRSLGAAARRREKPDLHPLGASEELYYRGLIGRAFLDARLNPGNLHLSQMKYSHFSESQTDEFTT